MNQEKASSDQAPSSATRDQAGHHLPGPTLQLQKETEPMDFKRIPVAIAAVLLGALPACSTVAVKTTPPAALAEQQAESSKPGEQAVSSQAEPPQQPASSPLVLRVNGVAITRLELDRSARALLAQNGMPEQVPPDVMLQAEDVALKQLTSAELIYQEARKIEVKELDRLVTEKIAEGKAKFASEAIFEKMLKDTGMTMAELRETTRKQIVVNQFIESRFVSRESASEADARTFYEENLQKFFTKGDLVKASHILVGVDQKAPAEGKKKALEKAEALLKRVQGGEDFAAIAKKESNCPSGANGGDLGIFGKGQMAAPFEAAAFALKPGETSTVVETEFGYHIIKLDQKFAASTDKFEDVKAKVMDFLKAEKVAKAIAAYLEELRSKAKIEKA
jgi:peptidyl-prolyl cis-trans isomerase C